MQIILTHWKLGDNGHNFVADILIIIPFKENIYISIKNWVKILLNGSIWYLSSIDLDNSMTSKNIAMHGGKQIAPMNDFPWIFSIIFRLSVWLWQLTCKEGIKNLVVRYPVCNIILQKCCWCLDNAGHFKTNPTMCNSSLVTKATLNTNTEILSLPQGRSAIMNVFAFEVFVYKLRQFEHKHWLQSGLPMHVLAIIQRNTH